MITAKPKVKKPGPQQMEAASSFLKQRSVEMSNILGHRVASDALTTYQMMELLRLDPRDIQVIIDQKVMILNALCASIVGVSSQLEGGKATQEAKTAL